MSYYSMMPSDGKLPFLKTMERWSYNKGWVVRWRKAQIYRAKAVVAAIVGIYFFPTAPVISLVAFCFAAFCKKWADEWQKMINDPGRSVMVAR